MRKPDARVLASCPRRCLPWEEVQERVLVLRPKLGNHLLGRWLTRFLKNPYYRIRLDRTGTLVWHLCDGKTPVAVIAERLRTCLGSDIEPAEERLYEFLLRMYRSRMIEFLQAGAPAPPGGEPPGWEE